MSASTSLFRASSRARRTRLRISADIKSTRRASSPLAQERISWASPASRLATRR
jgi:hypothetical protein